MIDWLIDMTFTAKALTTVFIHCSIAHESLYTIFNVSKEGMYLLYGEVQIEEIEGEKEEDRTVLFFSKKCEDCDPDFKTVKSINCNSISFFVDHQKLYNGSSVYLQFNRHEKIKTSSFTVYEVCK